MSDEVKQAQDRARLACVRMWDRTYEKLALQVQPVAERDCIGIEIESVLAESMLTVAVGKVVAWQGPREVAAMLRSIAANFEKLADGVDAAIVEVGGGSVEIKRAN
jgi:hypothetical protein